MASNPVVASLARQFDAYGLSFETGLGGAAQFRKSLEQELLPVLQEQFRLDLADLGLFGHSAGGAFVADALLSGNSVFSKFVIGTFGTDWWGDSLNSVETTLQPLEGRSVQIFYGYGGGGAEDFGAEVTQSPIDLLERMRCRAPEYIKSLQIRKFEREQHASIMAHILASGIHELWGTNMSYQAALKSYKEDWHRYCRFARKSEPPFAINPDPGSTFYFFEQEKLFSP